MSNHHLPLHTFPERQVRTFKLGECQLRASSTHRARYMAFVLLEDAWPLRDAAGTPTEAQPMGYIQKSSWRPNSGEPRVSGLAPKATAITYLAV